MFNVSQYNILTSIHEMLLGIISTHKCLIVKLNARRFHNHEHKISMLNDNCKFCNNKTTIRDKITLKILILLSLEN